MQPREDLSKSDWSDDETGEKTKATFVGWLEAMPEPDREVPSEELVQTLISAIFGHARHATVRNPVRSIDRCPICGCTVYVSERGTFAAAASDAEVMQARARVMAEGNDWDILGMSEIWLKNPAGGHFVAPTLIAHFVRDHGYQPPQAFLHSLMSAL
jgi:hypothetical protein